MRVGILTDAGSFYAPRVLARSSLRDEHDIVSIWSKSDRATALGRLRASLRKSGLRYTTDRAWALAKLRRKHFAESRSGLALDELEMPVGADLDMIGLPLREIQTANGEDFRSAISEARLDVLVSLFYGEVLDEATFSRPALGTINVHPSLLPTLAGRNPVFWAMAEGLNETGVTIHRINAGIDAGEVLDQAKVAIRSEQTHHALYLEICDLISVRLPFVVSKLLTGSRSNLATNDATREPSYRSTPDVASYRAFRAMGHRFL